MNFGGIVDWSFWILLASRLTLIHQPQSNIDDLNILKKLSKYFAIRIEIQP